jgi:hypothetical protein
MEYWNKNIESQPSTSLLRHSNNPKLRKGRNMTAKKRTAATALLLCIWMLGGCVAVIVGAGVGAGAYTYVQGDLKRSYPVKFDKALNVCTSILDDLDQPIVEKTTDGEKTTIKTKKKDGSPQTINIAIESVERTQISVRTGVFGYWKRKVSQQFHEFIAERLKE